MVLIVHDRYFQLYSIIDSNIGAHMFRITCKANLTRMLCFYHLARVTEESVLICFVHCGERHAWTHPSTRGCRGYGAEVEGRQEAKPNDGNPPGGFIIKTSPVHIRVPRCLSPCLSDRSRLARRNSDEMGPLVAYAGLPATLVYDSYGP